MNYNISDERIEYLKKLRQRTIQENQAYFSEEDTINKELEWDRYIARNTKSILDEYDKEFQQLTKLSSRDIKFVFLATALQCIRQYFFSYFQVRVDDKTAAQIVKGNTKEHSNRKHKYYWPSLQEIISNPVPFDTVFGSREKGLGIGGGFNHRAKTLGHDPVLGWFFGTLNILTSTITLNTFDTYHVKTAEIHMKGARDKISEKASTEKMIGYSLKRFMSGNQEDLMAIGVSLLKEAIHLKSDINSIAGLPLPIISTFSVEQAARLARYGMDMGNILHCGKQAAYAEAINLLIAMIHQLFSGQENVSADLLKIRTRKIIKYSNAIATGSNIIATSIGVITQNGTLVRKIDIGGFLVTVNKIVSDRMFIKDLEEEYILNNYRRLI